MRESTRGARPRELPLVRDPLGCGAETGGLRGESESAQAFVAPLFGVLDRRGRSGLRSVSSGPEADRRGSGWPIGIPESNL